MNRYIIICQDFDGELYQNSIRTFAKYSDTFSLVINCSSENKAGALQDFKNKLSPYCIQVDEKRNSWHTGGYGSASNIYHYKVTPESIDMLLSHTEAFFESFNGNTVPEDLAFAKDGKHWVVTCSHETCADIHPATEDILKEIKGLEYMSPYALIREKEDTN